MKCTVYAGTSETDFKKNRGTEDVEIHNPSRRHDVRYVREPCERCGAESISGEEVTSSRSKKETVVITEMELDQETLRAAISATGYDVGEIQKEPWHKKGLFGR